MAEKANDYQICGEHYRKNPIQPLDYIAANGLCFFSGNVLKYISRYRVTENIDDLRKARHYLEKMIEIEMRKFDEYV